ncbi:MAG: type secretion protein ImpA, partial [Variovorax sp.]|nr:type secretion protein ImpA [Variovorax sp.]
GRLHNQTNLPPWQLPAQSALSGFRSRELTPEGGNAAGGRSNHLVLDDTVGKIQAQLKSDDQSSSLSLGSITRIEDNAGRKDARGHGFELRTDAHGVLRAKDGLLISTEGRSEAQAHITDMAETVARLTHARNLHDNLGAAAKEAKAQDAGDQDGVALALKVQNDDIRGAGKQPHPESGEFPELDAPHIVIASPAGIGATSAQDTHFHAGEHIALTSDKHTSIAAGQSFLASAKNAIRLFAYGTGMRMIAYAGDIEVKALKNSISILAQLNITQTADEITIAARKKLTLNGGGSTIKLDASGIEEATPGPHRVFASVHSKVGPKNAPTPTLSGTSSLKEDKLEEENALSFILRSHPEDGRVIAMEPYTLYKDGAQVEKGATDARGRILIKNHKKGTSAYKVKLSNGNEFELPVVQKLRSPDEKLAARGYRAAQDDPQDRHHHFQQRQGGEGEV